MKCICPYLDLLSKWEKITKHKSMYSIPSKPEVYWSLILCSFALLFETWNHAEGFNKSSKMMSPADKCWACKHVPACLFHFVQFMLYLLWIFNKKIKRSRHWPRGFFFFYKYEPHKRQQESRSYRKELLVKKTLY